MDTLSLDPKRTALIVIDLQNFIVSRATEPHTTATVIANSVRLADALRTVGATVVWVNVDITQGLAMPADQAFRLPSELPSNATSLVDALNVQPGDVRVTKRQWGAFYGTTLEQDLRRRKIETIVLSGVSTNAGVESTARAAHDRGYALVFAEDATASSVGSAAHAFSMQQVFPRMGRVRSTQQIIDAIPT